MNLRVIKYLGLILGSYDRSTFKKCLNKKKDFVDGPETIKTANDLINGYGIIFIEI